VGKAWPREKGSQAGAMERVDVPVSVTSYNRGEMHRCALGDWSVRKRMGHSPMRSLLLTMAQPIIRVRWPRK